MKISITKPNLHSTRWLQFGNISITSTTECRLSDKNKYSFNQFKLRCLVLTVS